MTRDVEATVARHMTRRAVVVGPLAVAVAWLVGGARPALAAAIGVAVVVANFLASGLILSLAARISLSLYHAAALGGFLLRLAAITISMLLVARLVDIDRPAFGIAAVATYLVLLTWEAVTIARSDEREVEWTA